MAQVRESSMPAIGTWERFFDPSEVIHAFGLAATHRVLELGTGYGTFTVPVARRCRHIRTIEIEPSLVERLQSDPRSACLPIQCVVGDFLIPEVLRGGEPFDVVLLFNILHMERPVELLRAVAPLLAASGFIAIMHWRSDIETPRGPPIDIRPTPAACVEWCRIAGFTTAEQIDLAAAPYHFGIRASRGTDPGCGGIHAGHDGGRGDSGSG